jgi:excisionase family DNA binding protein
MKGYLTTTQTAKKLNVSQARVRQLIIAGTIKAEKFGRDNFITDAEVKRIVSLVRKTGRPRKNKVNE